jgi:hypothetical protein
VTIMLRACTIDGFGWFRAGDFRRAYLLFDEIEYVFPDEEVGDLYYPPPVLHRPEYRAKRVALNNVLVRVETTVIAACRDPAFVRLIAGVPADDRRYAVEVARTDRELRTITRLDPLHEDAAAIAALVVKLLTYAAHTNTVPIVGKAYAYPLIRRILELADDLSRTTLVPDHGGVLASPHQRIAVAGLAAGLSLEWLATTALERLPFAVLTEFKSRHAHLLQNHQIHLIEASQALRELPDGPAFAERLAALRLLAVKQRAAMDEEARSAWRSLGLDLARQAIVVGAGAAIPAIAAVRGLGLAELLGLAAPGVLAGAGLVVKSVIDAAERRHHVMPSAMAYVFEGQALLERWPG